MNKVKECPIILTADEVNAVLAGDKTQHRAPAKLRYGMPEFMGGMYCDKSDPREWGWDNFEDGETRLLSDESCPFGAIGDRLWVKEDHRPVNWTFDDGEVQIEYRNGTKRWVQYLTDEEFETNPNDDYLIEICDELIARSVPLQDGKDCFDFSNPENLPHWRTADVMPQFASRILLEITDIRIERVQDITVINAQAEGSPLQISITYFASPFHKACSEIMEWFKDYWNNKQSKMNSYEANPWVWVIEFKIVKESNHG